MAGELNIANGDAVNVTASDAGGGWGAEVDANTGNVTAAPYHDLVDVTYPGATAGQVMLPNGYDLSQGLPPDFYAAGPSSDGFATIYNGAGRAIGWANTFAVENLQPLPVEQVSMTLSEATAGVIGQPAGAFDALDGALFTEPRAATLNWVTGAIAQDYGFMGGMVNDPRTGAELAG